MGSVADNLKKQLALTVRSLQWSYAIFWSPSTSQPGVLEFGDGYYNGDIKTRKTVQSAELNVDELGLQRSEQLRELFESLSASEPNPQAKRPSAALSPEDLTDTEWYYLVCMSFVFDVGQGLPGRTLATGKPIWLCDAHCVESKVFTRSLLAKSASIQTVVCFPYLGGIIELGVTELVVEDPSLIHHIKASFLEVKDPTMANNSSSRGKKELHFTGHDHMVNDCRLVSSAGYKESDLASCSNSSDNQPADSIFTEGVNGEASMVKSWQLMDEDFSNCILQSVNSSNCISQTLVDPVSIIPIRYQDKLKEHPLQEVQEGNNPRLSSPNLHSDDLHYHSVLSSLLKTSHPLILCQNTQNCRKESSFVGWEKVGLLQAKKLNSKTPQEVLKKILFEVPRMHIDGLLQIPEDGSKLDVDEVGNHAISERRRREKLNEKFTVLKSVLPSINKVDKVAILDDTIEYLQELEHRVGELERSTGLREFDTSTKGKHQDSVERTSDNYESNIICYNKRPLKYKRKAYDAETEKETDYKLSKDSSADIITISSNQEETQIDIKCQWKEGILLEIMEVVSHLHIDANSVQSTNVEGVFNLTIKSKNTRLNASSARAIKHALERVAGRC